MAIALNPIRHEAADARSNRPGGGSGASPEPGALRLWWPILIGLLALYLPTYYDLAHGIWNSEEQAHGPIVLVVALYLIFFEKF